MASARDVAAIAVKPLCFMRLAPAKGKVGTEVVEPDDDAGVAALFTEAELGAEGAAHFGGVVAGGDGFFDVGGEFLVDIVIETVSG